MPVARAQRHRVGEGLRACAQIEPPFMTVVPPPFAVSQAVASGSPIAPSKVVTPLLWVVSALAAPLESIGPEKWMLPPAAAALPPLAKNVDRRRAEQRRVLHSIAAPVLAVLVPVAPPPLDITVSAADRDGASPTPAASSVIAPPLPPRH